MLYPSQQNRIVCFIAQFFSLTFAGCIKTVHGGILPDACSMLYCSSLAFYKREHAHVYIFCRTIRTFFMLKICYFLPLPQTQQQRWCGVNSFHTWFRFTYMFLTSYIFRFVLLNPQNLNYLQYLKLQWILWIRILYSCIKKTLNETSIQN